MSNELILCSKVAVCCECSIEEGNDDMASWGLVGMYMA